MAAIVFISPRCLEPVELTKNLDRNRIISIQLRLSSEIFIFLKTRLLRVLKFI